MGNPFDHLAADYDRNGAHAARAAELIALAADTFADVPPTTILDVATGTGAAAFAALAMFPGAHVTAVDLSAGMIERARSLADDRSAAGRINWLCGSAVPFPAEDESADLVLCTSSMHFLGVTAFADWQRVLRAGGVAAYTLPLRSTFRPGAVFAELMPRDEDRVSLPDNETEAEELARAVPGFTPIAVTVGDGAASFVIGKS